MKLTTSIPFKSYPDYSTDKRVIIVRQTLALISGKSIEPLIFRRAFRILITQSTFSKASGSISACLQYFTN
ncbi:MAG: hypothetical protein LBG28_08780 [Tannerella sp.]|nr:hypothetical protein [Tannerella sp.]